MLSKSRIAYIRSLALKKFRDRHHQFIAEGTKLVTDLLQSRYNLESIYSTPGWQDQYGDLAAGRKIPVTEIGGDQMKRITALSTPSPVLALADIPDSALDIEIFGKELVLALDDIRDPGNLGTIVRLADWFGISTILCSGTTVDLYNPKTIQATMGSVARVRVIYGDLPEMLHAASSRCTIWGTFLEGEPVYEAALETTGVLVIGNEAGGISGPVERMIGRKLFIPSFGKREDPSGRPESLNASIAAAIVCSEFRRQTMKPATR